MPAMAQQCDAFVCDGFALFAVIAVQTAMVRCPLRLCASALKYNACDGCDDFVCGALAILAPFAVQDAMVRSSLR
jgi:hypothetical protein